MKGMFRLSAVICFLVGIFYPVSVFLAEKEDGVDHTVPSSAGDPSLGLKGVQFEPLRPHMDRKEILSLMDRNALHLLGQLRYLGKVENTPGFSSGAPQEEINRAVLRMKRSLIDQYGAYYQEKTGQNLEKKLDPLTTAGNNLSPVMSELGSFLNADFKKLFDDALSRMGQQNAKEFSFDVLRTPGQEKYFRDKLALFFKDEKVAVSEELKPIINKILSKGIEWGEDKEAILDVSKWAAEAARDARGKDNELEKVTNLLSAWTQGKLDHQTDEELGELSAEVDGLRGALLDAKFRFLKPVPAVEDVAEQKRAGAAIFKENTDIFFEHLKNFSQAKNHALYKKFCEYEGGRPGCLSLSALEKRYLAYFYEALKLMNIPRDNRRLVAEVFPAEVLLLADKLSGSYYFWTKLHELAGESGTSVGGLSQFEGGHKRPSELKPEELLELKRNLEKSVFDLTSSKPELAEAHALAVSVLEAGGQELLPKEGSHQEGAIAPERFQARGAMAHLSAKKAVSNKYKPTFELKPFEGWVSSSQLLNNPETRKLSEQQRQELSRQANIANSAKHMGGLKDLVYRLLSVLEDPKTDGAKLVLQFGHYFLEYVSRGQTDLEEALKSNKLTIERAKELIAGQLLRDYLVQYQRVEDKIFNGVDFFGDDILLLADRAGPGRRRFINAMETGLFGAPESLLGKGRSLAEALIPDAGQRERIKGLLAELETSKETPATRAELLKWVSQHQMTPGFADTLGSLRGYLERPKMAGILTPTHANSLLTLRGSRPWMDPVDTEKFSAVLPKQRKTAEAPVCPAVPTLEEARKSIGVTPAWVGVDRKSSWDDQVSVFEKNKSKAYESLFALQVMEAGKAQCKAPQAGLKSTAAGSKPTEECQLRDEYQRQQSLVLNSFLDWFNGAVQGRSAGELLKLSPDVLLLVDRAHRARGEAGHHYFLSKAISVLRNVASDKDIQEIIDETKAAFEEAEGEGEEEEEEQAAEAGAPAAAGKEAAKKEASAGKAPPTTYTAQAARLYFSLLPIYRGLVKPESVDEETLGEMKSFMESILSQCGKEKGVCDPEVEPVGELLLSVFSMKNEPLGYFSGPFNTLKGNERERISIEMQHNDRFLASCVRSKRSAFRDVAGDKPPVKVDVQGPVGLPQVTWGGAKVEGKYSSQTGTPFIMPPYQAKPEDLEAIAEHNTTQLFKALELLKDAKISFEDFKRQFGSYYEDLLRKEGKAVDWAKLQKIWDQSEKEYVAPSEKDKVVPLVMNALMKDYGKWFKTVAEGLGVKGLSRLSNKTLSLAQASDALSDLAPLSERFHTELGKIKDGYDRNRLVAVLNDYKTYDPELGALEPDSLERLVTDLRREPGEDYKAHIGRLEKIRSWLMGDGKRTGAFNRIKAVSPEHAELVALALNAIDNHGLFLAEKAWVRRSLHDPKEARDSYAKEQMLRERMPQAAKLVDAIAAFFAEKGEMLPHEVRLAILEKYDPQQVADLFSRMAKYKRQDFRNLIMSLDPAKVAEAHRLWGRYGYEEREGMKPHGFKDRQWAKQAYEMVKSHDFTREELAQIFDQYYLGKRGWSLHEEFTSFNRRPEEMASEGDKSALMCSLLSDSLGLHHYYYLDDSGMKDNSASVRFLMRQQIGASKQGRLVEMVADYWSDTATIGAIERTVEDLFYKGAAPKEAYPKIEETARLLKVLKTYRRHYERPTEAELDDEEAAFFTAKPYATYDDLKWHIQQKWPRLEDQPYLEALRKEVERVYEGRIPQDPNAPKAREEFIQKRVDLAYYLSEPTKRPESIEEDVQNGQISGFVHFYDKSGKEHWVKFGDGELDVLSQAAHFAKLTDIYGDKYWMSEDEKNLWKSCRLALERDREELRYPHVLSELNPDVKNTLRSIFDSQRAELDQVTGSEPSFKQAHPEIPPLPGQVEISVNAVPGKGIQTDHKVTVFDESQNEVQKSYLHLVLCSPENYQEELINQPITFKVGRAKPEGCQSCLGEQKFKEGDWNWKLYLSQYRDQLMQDIAKLKENSSHAETFPDYMKNTECFVGKDREQVASMMRLALANVVRSIDRSFALRFEDAKVDTHFLSTTFTGDIRQYLTQLEMEHEAVYKPKNPFADSTDPERFLKDEFYMNDRNFIEYLERSCLGGGANIRKTPFIGLPSYSRIALLELSLPLRRELARQVSVRCHEAGQLDREAFLLEEIITREKGLYESNKKKADSLDSMLDLQFRLPKHAWEASRVGYDMSVRQHAKYEPVINEARKIAASAKARFEPLEPRARELRKRSLAMREGVASLLLNPEGAKLTRGGMWVNGSEAAKAVAFLEDKKNKVTDQAALDIVKAYKELGDLHDLRSPAKWQRLEDLRKKIIDESARLKGRESRLDVVSELDKILGRLDEAKEKYRFIFSLKAHEDPKAKERRAEMALGAKKVVDGFGDLSKLTKPEDVKGLEDELKKLGIADHRVLDVINWFKLNPSITIPSDISFYVGELINDSHIGEILRGFSTLGDLSQRRDEASLKKIEAMRTHILELLAELYEADGGDKKKEDPSCNSLLGICPTDKKKDEKKDDKEHLKREELAGRLGFLLEAIDGRGHSTLHQSDPKLKAQYEANLGGNGRFELSALGKKAKEELEKLRDYCEHPTGPKPLRCDYLHQTILAVHAKGMGVSQNARLQYLDEKMTDDEINRLERVIAGNLGQRDKAAHDDPQKAVDHLRAIAPFDAASVQKVWDTKDHFYRQSHLSFTFLSEEVIDEFIKSADRARVIIADGKPSGVDVEGKCELEDGEMKCDPGGVKYTPKVVGCREVEEGGSVDSEGNPKKVVDGRVLYDLEFLNGKEIEKKLNALATFKAVLLAAEELRMSLPDPDEKPTPKQIEAVLKRDDIRVRARKMVEFDLRKMAARRIMGRKIAGRGLFEKRLKAQSLYEASLEEKDPARRAKLQKESEEIMEQVASIRYDEVGLDDQNSETGCSLRGLLGPVYMHSVMEAVKKGIRKKLSDAMEVEEKEKVERRLEGSGLKKGTKEYQDEFEKRIETAKRERENEIEQRTMEHFQNYMSFQPDEFVAALLGLDWGGDKGKIPALIHDHLTHEVDRRYFEANVTDTWDTPGVIHGAGQEALGLSEEVELNEFLRGSIPACVKGVEEGPVDLTQLQILIDQTNKEGEALENRARTDHVDKGNKEKAMEAFIAAQELQQALSGGKVTPQGLHVRADHLEEVALSEMKKGNFKSADVNRQASQRVHNAANMLGLPLWKVDPTAEIEELKQILGRSVHAQQSVLAIQGREVAERSNMVDIMRGRYSQEIDHINGQIKQLKESIDKVKEEADKAGPNIYGNMPTAFVEQKTEIENEIYHYRRQVEKVYARQYADVLKYEMVAGKTREDVKTGEERKLEDDMEKTLSGLMKEEVKKRRASVDEATRSLIKGLEGKDDPVSKAEKARLERKLKLSAEFNDRDFFLDFAWGAGGHLKDQGLRAFYQVPADTAEKEELKKRAESFAKRSPEFKKKSLELGARVQGLINSKIDADKATGQWGVGGFWDALRREFTDKRKIKEPEDKSNQKTQLEARVRGDFLSELIQLKLIAVGRNVEGKYHEDEARELTESMGKKIEELRDSSQASLVENFDGFAESCMKWLEEKKGVVFPRKAGAGEDGEVSKDEVRARGYLTEDKKAFAQALFQYSMARQKARDYFASTQPPTGSDAVFMAEGKGSEYGRSVNYASNRKGFDDLLRTFTGPDNPFHFDPQNQDQMAELHGQFEGEWKRAKRERDFADEKLKKILAELSPYKVGWDGTKVVWNKAELWRLKTDQEKEKFIAALRQLSQYGQYQMMGVDPWAEFVDNMFMLHTRSGFAPRFEMGPTVIHVRSVKKALDGKARNGYELLTDVENAHKYIDFLDSKTEKERCQQLSEKMDKAIETFSNQSNNVRAAANSFSAIWHDFLSKPNPWGDTRGIENPKVAEQYKKLSEVRQKILAHADLVEACGVLTVKYGPKDDKKEEKKEGDKKEKDERQNIMAQDLADRTRYVVKHQLDRDFYTKLNEDVTKSLGAGKRMVGEMVAIELAMIPLHILTAGATKVATTGIWAARLARIAKYAKDARNMASMVYWTSLGSKAVMDWKANKFGDYQYTIAQPWEQTLFGARRGALVFAVLPASHIVTRFIPAPQWITGPLGLYSVSTGINLALGDPIRQSLLSGLHSLPYGLPWGNWFGKLSAGMSPVGQRLVSGLGTYGAFAGSSLALEIGTYLFEGKYLDPHTGEEIKDKGKLEMIGKIAGNSLLSGLPMDAYFGIHAGISRGAHGISAATELRRGVKPEIIIAKYGGRWARITPKTPAETAKHKAALAKGRHVLAQGISQMTLREVDGIRRKANDLERELMSLKRDLVMVAPTEGGAKRERVSQLEAELAEVNGRLSIIAQTQGYHSGNADRDRTDYFREFDRMRKSGDFRLARIPRPYAAVAELTEAIRKDAVKSLLADFKAGKIGLETLLSKPVFYHRDFMDPERRQQFDPRSISEIPAQAIIDEMNKPENKTRKDYQKKLEQLALMGMQMTGFGVPKHHRFPRLVGKSTYEREFLDQKDAIRLAEFLKKHKPKEGETLEQSARIFANLSPQGIRERLVTGEVDADTIAETYPERRVASALDGMSMGEVVGLMEKAEKGAEKGAEKAKKALSLLSKYMGVKEDVFLHVMGRTKQQVEHEADMGDMVNFMSQVFAGMAGARVESSRTLGQMRHELYDRAGRSLRQWVLEGKNPEERQQRLSQMIGENNPFMHTPFGVKSVPVEELNLGRKRTETGEERYENEQHAGLVWKYARELGLSRNDATKFVEFVRKLQQERAAKGKGANEPDRLLLPNLYVDFQGKQRQMSPAELKKKLVAAEIPVKQALTDYTEKKVEDAVSGMAVWEIALAIKKAERGDANSRDLVSLMSSYTGLSEQLFVGAVADKTRVVERELNMDDPFVFMGNVVASATGQKMQSIRSLKDIAQETQRIAAQRLQAEVLSAPDLLSRQQAMDAMVRGASPFFLSSEGMAYVPVEHLRLGAVERVGGKLTAQLENEYHTDYVRRFGWYQGLRGDDVEEFLDYVVQRQQEVALAGGRVGLRFPTLMSEYKRKLEREGKAPGSEEPEAGPDSALLDLLREAEAGQ